MKLAVLFSGGKDSTYALHKAAKDNEISCLLSLYSYNKESYMFQSLGQELIALQAEALELPLLRMFTQGKKEEELKDLKKLLQKAKKEYKIEGVVTGALNSIYQASRIQEICFELNLHCFNPLWLKNQEELLEELFKKKFEVIFLGVFSYPFEEEMLGAKLDKKRIEKLRELKTKFHINPAGEGGEFESTVLDAPLFKKRIHIEEASKEWENYAGSYIIKEARLVQK